MEPFELTAMRQAARTVERWIREYGDDARRMVLEQCSGLYGDPGPEFWAAYLTAFGR